MGYLYKPVRMNGDRPMFELLFLLSELIIEPHRYPKGFLHRS